MSVSLDYGIEYRPTTAPVQKAVSKSRRYKQSRRKKVLQFFCDFPNCYYCGALLTKRNRSLDHWVPRVRGGTSKFDNLVTACKGCNVAKADSVPPDTITTLAWQTKKWFWHCQKIVINPMVFGNKNGR